MGVSWFGRVPSGPRARARSSRYPDADLIPHYHQCPREIPGRCGQSDDLVSTVGLVPIAFSTNSQSDNQATTGRRLACGFETRKMRCVMRIQLRLLLSTAFVVGVFTQLPGPGAVLSR